MSNEDPIEDDWKTIRLNNKAVIEERANSIVEALRKLPVDSVVYTTVNGLSLNPLEVITEVQGRTSIGCAILDHVNLEMFFKKVFGNAR